MVNNKQLKNLAGALKMESYIAPYRDSDFHKEPSQALLYRVFLLMMWWMAKSLLFVTQLFSVEYHTLGEVGMSLKGQASCTSLEFRDDDMVPARQRMMPLLPGLVER